MSISMRNLFSRRGIDGEIISLSNSIANHYQGLQMSLREAHEFFLRLVDGNGFTRGCKRGNDDVVYVEDYGFIEVGKVMPSWVSVRDDETRTLEGIVKISRAPHRDFPFKPWHKNYDWTFSVRLDKQYTYLHSPVNREAFDGAENLHLIECEWDTAYFPSWAWPQEGDRVWLVGRWIYDCGHLYDKQHRTEIHPIKAIATFRADAVKLPGNSGPTLVNNAILYIGRKGGYWDQPINDRDYAFDLYLPSILYKEAKVEPKWTVKAMTGASPSPVAMTGALPVQPRITPFPADAPRALRVVIPLKGIHPHPDEYGVIISAGWSDPYGTEAKKVKRVRVTIKKIIKKVYDIHVEREQTITSLHDKYLKWDVYVGINGRWQAFESPEGEIETSLNYSVDLDLVSESYYGNKIEITVSGRQLRAIDRLMGHNIGVTWQEVESLDKIAYVKEKITEGFRSLGAGAFEQDERVGEDTIDNERISTFRRTHCGIGGFAQNSPRNDYEIHYRIEDL